MGLGRDTVLDTQPVATGPDCQPRHVNDSAHANLLPVVLTAAGAEPVRVGVAKWPRFSRRQALPTTTCRIPGRRASHFHDSGERRHFEPDGQHCSDDSPSVMTSSLLVNRAAPREHGSDRASTQLTRRSPPPSDAPHPAPCGGMPSPRRRARSSPTQSGSKSSRPFRYRSISIGKSRDGRQSHHYLDPEVAACLRRARLRCGWSFRTAARFTGVDAG